MKGKGTRLTVALTIAVAMALGTVALAFAMKPGATSISYTRLAEIAVAHEATAAHIDGERVLVTVAGSVQEAVVTDPEARRRVVDAFADSGVELTFASQAPGVAERLFTLPIILLLVVAVGFAARAAMQKKTKTHFTEHLPTPGPKITFADVAGMPEVKESLRETVEFLRDPARFGRLGGRAPRGVLLSGEPGTGKTFLARAVANEAGVPFLSASGSSFQEMFVGVGAARVRSLFAEARRLAPCIVFIDEIDALGRARSKSGEASAAEHDQTLNQLLVEMDGFNTSSAAVVVIASTNRPDILDRAVLRPGRFDRQIVVPLPDARGRQEILTVHAKPVTMNPQVDLAQVARGTSGFSGADLANLLNEAAILAARDGAESVDPLHIERARDRVLMGEERHGFMMCPEERYATAVHEAGHVAAGMFSPNADPVHKVSILPRGRALGVTQSLPEKDRLMYKKEFLEDQICMLMGGRAAEMMILKTMTAGASDDIKRAAGIAHKMVAELGMSHLGCIHLSEDGHARSQALLDRIEDAARAIVDFQLMRACKIVETHSGAIERLVEQLLATDTLDAGQIRACFEEPLAA